VGSGGLAADLSGIVDGGVRDQIFGDGFDTGGDGQVADAIEEVASRRPP
jgi:hypothetical protein